MMITDARLTEHDIFSRAVLLAKSDMVTRLTS